MPAEKRVAVADVDEAAASAEAARIRALGGGEEWRRILAIDINVIIPTDGRHHRMLDLDEYADAMAEGTFPSKTTSTACGDGNDSSIATFMPVAGRKRT